MVTKNIMEITIKTLIPNHYMILTIYLTRKRFTDLLHLFIYLLNVLKLQVKRNFLGEFLFELYIIKLSVKLKMRKIFFLKSK